MSVNGVDAEDDLPASRREDPRPQRTRQALIDAAIRLSQSGSPLSVTAVAREAGVSRAGFYVHYSGLDELAISASRDAVGHIVDAYSGDGHRTTEDVYEGYRAWVTHISEFRPLYRAVSELTTRSDVQAANIRLLAAGFERSIAGHPRAPHDLDREAIALYVASGAFALTTAWLWDEIALTEEDLVQHLVRLVPGWYSGLDGHENRKEES